ncbi:ribonuclease HII [Thermoproteus tenax]|uniref:Ribonuclease HII n=1 Tax=Thermoproteus tenax (strain ATCC 35583 / DSM 2078 / JCM 9277 / NBRC 100435 / Kra 1) TaxID=768679 RepID=G4RKE8_THETK|nr:ribonuclease HII [Thermoproteus tenax]CCC82043.1 Ribonuclease HII [Thermoproteus tenax Kra 1]
MVVAGIDEAGRGPLVGPMVVAIVAGDNERLRSLGVRDSKTLTPQRRKSLYSAVLQTAECVNYIVIEPAVIDQYVGSRKLNLLEAEAMAQLINLCEADAYYVDAPDPVAERFGRALSAATGRSVTALHKAERVPAVAAASIVAKVVRDSLMELLRREMGEIGSGYPSDRRTLEAVRAGRVAPECLRRTWKTMRDIKT